MHVLGEGCRWRSLPHRAGGRDEEPSLAILDSQSVGAEKRGGGFDGGKLVKGRRRFVAVDPLGLLLTVQGVAASVSERTGGKALLRSLAGGPRLRKALVDGGFSGAPMADLGRSLGIEVEAVASVKGRGFKLQARRWVVERTFAWLVKCRRLRVAYEERPRTTVAWVRAAMVRLMARRLAKAAWTASQPLRAFPQAHLSGTRPPRPCAS